MQTDLEKSNVPVENKIPETNKEHIQEEQDKLGPSEIDIVQNPPNVNTVADRFYENSMSFHSQQVSAINALKQQEAQLLMAARLRGQEEHMAFLQKRFL